jgi:RNA polymerase sigma factor CnrH
MAGAAEIVATDGAGAAPSDGELAQLALAGDPHAFSHLASRHKTWLFRFIRRYVGNDADALDLLQDAMVAAWLALDRYDPARPYQAWLRLIALNKCRDWSRRSVLRRVVGYFAADVDGVPAPARHSDPETMCMADESLLRLDRAIAALPRGLREPFVLSAFEGLSHREAAALLQLSEKAVETRIYRARQQLMRVIDRGELNALVEGAMP